MAERIKSLLFHNNGKPKLSNFLIIFFVILFAIIIIGANVFKDNKLVKGNLYLKELTETAKQKKTDQEFEEYYFSKAEVQAIVDKTVNEILGQKIFDLMDSSQRDILSVVDTKILDASNILGEKQEIFEGNIVQSISNFEDKLINNIEKLSKQINKAEPVSSRYDIDVAKYASAYAYDYGSGSKGNMDDIIENSANRFNSKLISNVSIGGHSSVIVSAKKPQLLANNGKDANFIETHGVLAGIVIPGKLKVGLISSVHSSPAIIEVVEDIYLDEELLIPTGSLFFGKGAADFGVRKIFISLDRLVVGNREIKVSAHAVNANMMAGFQSKYIDLKKEKFWSTFLLNFATGMLGCFRDVVYRVGDDNIPLQYYPVTWKNMMISGAGTGVSEWTDRIMHDAQSQSAIITVDSNLDVNIIINECIDWENFI